MCVVAASCTWSAWRPCRQSPATLVRRSRRRWPRFAVGEWWRVFIHFRQEAQSFSLSEIPLVIGVFVLAGDPGALVLARVLGAAIGLGLLRRQEPMKLIFNLASFALETETVTILVHHISGTDADDPVDVALGRCSSCRRVAARSRTHGACDLARGGPAVTPPVVPADRHRAGRRLRELQPRTGGGGAATSAIAWVLLLLLTPLAAIGASYVLYTREHQKHQRLQYLYESSDMLQRASSDGAAIPELLDQLCKVFRADIATVSLLPVATGTGSWRTISTSRGTERQRRQCAERRASWSASSRSSTRPSAGLIVTPVHRRIRSSGNGSREQGYRDAMATLLQGEGMLLGTLVVANRMSDVGTFDTDDLHLFDAFAAQTSVAVQNTRLGHRLRQQAFHDTLTDLANRALFMDRLEHALTRRERHDESLAVMFLDLDDFKEINDSLGHMAGDELLARVADRLKVVLRASDTAARFGGDEFAILVEETADPEDTIRVAERVVSVFKPRFVLAGREVTISASVGVAVTASRDITRRGAGRPGRRRHVPRQGQGQGHVRDLRAGHAGRGRAPSRGAHRPRARHRSQRARGHVSADRRHHQQHARSASRHWSAGSTRAGAWSLPLEFIGIAEETGMIRELGLHVLEEACRQWQEWQVELIDEPAFTVSVNVSPRQLRDPSFVSEVWRILTRVGLPPSHLTLEITESFMVDDPESARAPPARAQGARRAHLDGRLRHRLLVARVAAGPAAGRAQDRQALRRPRGRGSRAGPRSRRRSSGWARRLGSA